jgi:hypothetical protein
MLPATFRRATAEWMLQELRHSFESRPAARRGHVELAVEEPGASKSVELWIKKPGTHWYP